MRTTVFSALAVIATALGGGAVLLSGASAQIARPECGNVQEIHKRLTTDYGESVVGGGIVNENVVMEIYVSKGGDTWTVVQIGTDGSACMVSAGRSWFGQLPAPRGEGRDS